jgi:hypothetical protein
MTRDLSNLEPAPPPSPERLEHASQVLARFSEVAGLDEWRATFRRDNLECTGIWPPEMYDVGLSEFEVPIEASNLCVGDSEGSYQRQLECCRLAVRHGIERAELERSQMREALTEEEAS